MRGLLVACMLALLGCTMKPAAAQQRAPASDAVEACLGSAGSDHEAQRACIGRVTNQCVESDPSANTSTPGMAACATSERTQWAALRDRYVAQLRSQGTQTQNALLDAMLAEHEDWARARCAYSASYYEGGTLGRVQGAACMRDSEADLALDLHGRLFDDR